MLCRSGAEDSVGSPLTSFDPEVFAELVGHADEERLPLWGYCFVEIVTTATNNLQAKTPISPDVAHNLTIEQLYISMYLNDYGK